MLLCEYMYLVKNPNERVSSIMKNTSSQREYMKFEKITKHNIIHV